MQTLGELCLFLTDDVYLIKNDIVGSVVQPKFETRVVLEESEIETKESEEPIEEPLVSVKKEPTVYKPILFVFDEEPTSLARETFNNLVSKGLALGENEFSTIKQEQVSFGNPEEINSQKVILFDVPFSNYQTKYKLFHTQKQLVLLADSMEKIAHNVDLKRMLWAQLQLMFPKKA